MYAEAGKISVNQIGVNFNMHLASARFWAIFLSLIPVRLRNRSKKNRMQNTNNDHLNSANQLEATEDESKWVEETRTGKSHHGLGRWAVEFGVGVMSDNDTLGTPNRPL